MNWINDFCENGNVNGRRRAEGILKIHAPCTPPCPRARAAANFLARQSSSDGSGVAGGDYPSDTTLACPETTVSS